MVRKYKDAEWLSNEYLSKEKPSTQIARELGVSKATILNWLDRHDIPTRKRGPQKGREFGDTSNLQDEGWLRHQYVELEKSAGKIAADENVGDQTVINWLNNHGIETRGMHEASRECTSTKDKRLNDEGWLRKEYQDKERTMANIAEELDVTIPTVKYWLDRKGIDRRNDGSHGLTGDSEFQRDPNWPQKRESRLEIDGGECQDCGVTEEDYYRSLDVHHKKKKEEFVNGDGSVDWESANAMDNLVSLCQSCHMKRHHENEG